MDAVAPALVGLGLWLAYEAYKNPAPAPLKKITSAIQSPSQTAKAA